MRQKRPIFVRGPEIIGKVVEREKVGAKNGKREHAVISNRGKFVTEGDHQSEKLHKTAPKSLSGKNVRFLSGANFPLVSDEFPFLTEAQKNRKIIGENRNASDVEN